MVARPRLCYQCAMVEVAYNYVLCSNPRSGTTLMCDMLAQTGVAGKPNSFFREKSLQDWCDQWGLPAPYDLDDPAFMSLYLDAAGKEGRGETPVFGLRLMGPDLGYSTQLLRQHYPETTTDLAAFEVAFGPLKFIHLKREDKLAEAISYLRAEQTGLWHQNADGSIMEEIAPSQADGFDAGAIKERLSMLSAFEKDWDKWFAAEGINPLRLTYENLAEDPQTGLGAVLAHIGQDRHLASAVKPGLRKLADATSSAWMTRYRELFPDS